MTSVRVRILSLAGLALALASCEPLPMAVTVAPNPVAYTQPHPGGAGQMAPTIGPAPAVTPRPKAWPAPDDPLVSVPLYTAPVYRSVGPEGRQSP